MEQFKVIQAIKYPGKHFEKGQIIDGSAFTAQELADAEFFKFFDPEAPWEPSNDEDVYVLRTVNAYYDFNIDDISVEQFLEGNAEYEALKTRGYIFKTITARRNAGNKVSDVLANSPKDTPDE